MTKYIDLPGQHKLQTDFFFFAWPFHERVTCLFVIAVDVVEFYKPDSFLGKSRGFKIIFFQIEVDH